MSLETKVYEFERCVLDLADRTLYRDGHRVDLSIKGFEVLRVLFENRPNVVEKRALIEAVWPDSFVEEGNLTFTVSQLRKALDDPKTGSRIIETAYRRGYRFIAEAKPFSDKQVAEPTDRSENRRSRWPWVVLAAGVLLFLGVGVSMFSGRLSPEPFILKGPVSMEKLSTSGKVAHAVISPDGKYVVYTDGIRKGQQSLWLRQVDSGSTVELIKPADHQYLGLALSPDSNFVYFARTNAAADLLTIYRVSIFGGVPVKIAEGTQGWMSISPDGRLISYVRCRYVPDDNCSLYAADAVDGANERKLITHAEPIRIGDNEFSPDGRSIAYAYGQSDSGEDNFRLAEVDVTSGVTRDVSAHRFFNIKSILWLPDKTGWIITANTKIGPDLPILQIPADGGAPAKLTNDSETYSGLSASAGMNAIVTTRARRNTSLYTIDMQRKLEYDLGSPTSSVVFSPAGRVYFSSARSGNYDIWSANADGGDQRQLTNSAGIDFVPLVTRDNRWVYFSSSRSGEPQIWRMSADGSEQVRVTSVNGGWPIFVTDDGAWVYYRQWARGTLWKVSTATGEEIEVLTRTASRFSISPDGTSVLVASGDPVGVSIDQVKIESGEILRAFQLSDRSARVVEYGWVNDGRSFLFVIVLGDGTKEVWRQELAATAPQLIRRLTRPDPLHFFAVAGDGKRFAVIQGDWQHDAVLISKASRD
jgi:Tol biopolymer transport system component/DNA-binding winged helix-turn-helix (wHTH) protein